MRVTPLIAAVAVVLAGCEGSPGAPRPVDSLNLTPVVTGLSDPVFLTSPAGDPRLFIVELPGTIRVVKNGRLLPTPYLDIASKVITGGERGLLGLAFHPQFATNGFFYVYYADRNSDIKIERYHATPSSDVAEAGSGTPVLGFPHPGFADHYGGMLLFGPDNMLWIGLGDGGGGGDPNGNAQRLTTLLGKMLRIDVNGGSPYAIPASNPFAGQPGSRGEVWAYGLRNPWRYSIDRAQGLLYIADVGQESWEEVNVVPVTRAGVNYGWNIMEGLTCFNTTTCNQAALEKPVLVYPHTEGCAVTGGYVYRGTAIPDMRGEYFYSDFCTGFLRSFRFSNGLILDRRSWDVGDIGSVASFGEDSQGELYVLSFNGTVYKLTP